MSIIILFSNTITNLDSLYLNRDPIYDTELATKQYTDTLFDDESILKIPVILI